MNHKNRAVIISLLTAALILPLVSCADIEPEQERITVRLAAPQSPYIQDFDNNLYKLWLEEQTGLNIEMIWLPGDDAEAIALRQLQSGDNMPDAYVGFGTYDLFAGANVQIYGERGVIIALDDLIETYGIYIKNLWEELPDYNIEGYMTSSDGKIYFMPGFSSSTITRYRQLMWINEGWLDDLSLAVPTTTEQLRDTLRAFKEAYPGCVPMAGTDDSYSKQPYDFIFNAFIYNDVRNSRLLLEDGVIGFAPVRDEWRDALVYMHELYDEGLYSPLSFVQDDQQLKQMANDPLDILGVFLSPGITMTVLQNSPEIIERYTGIPPLTGPDGVRLTSVFTPIPRPNGVITSACEHPEEVFKLFDLMLSEQASLMGRYGEQGVDWDFADAGSGEISIYGTPATIRIINQIWNTPQNKHLSQIVPYVSRPKFSGGVTWDGNETDGEYMNAQSAMLHMGFEPEEYVGALVYTPQEEVLISSVRTDIEEYTRKSAADFITGTRDINDNNEWAEYKKEFYALGLDEFLSVAQRAYDRAEG